jgi:predicted metal-binding membrane protein
MWAVSDRKLFTTLLVVLIVLAWVVLWIWGQSPYGRFLNHEGLYNIEAFHGSGHHMNHEQPDGIKAIFGNSHLMLALAYIAGWTLMTVAMMLPTSLPLVTLFHTITQKRSDHAQLVILLITGYISIWMLFGIIAHVGDLGLLEVVKQNAWVRTNAWVLGVGLLLMAGLYQFTPLKYYCLDKCRSPLSFITDHWQGNHEKSHAFWLGVHHGVFCIGCCWSLMLLMFLVSVGNIGWMLALGAVMAVEKNTSWGRQFSAPLGAVLVLWGLILVALGLE